MRYLTIILLGLFILIGSPTATVAGKSGPYWTCMQIGFIQEDPVLILSYPQNTYWEDTLERAELFAKVVKKSFPIKDEYEPYCRDFPTKKDIDNFQVQLIHKSKKAKLSVRVFSFNINQGVSCETSLCKTQ